MKCGQKLMLYAQERETKQRWKQPKAGTTEHQLEQELLRRRPSRTGEEDSTWGRKKEVEGWGRGAL